MANRAPRTQKTWSLLGDVRRKPSTYEVTAARFHYHFRREPAPFELDPGMPLNRWYLEYREGSPFQVDDWEGFRDPHKLTYKDYVALQHDRETYLDLLIDTHEAAGSVTRLDPAWVATLRALFVPLRFPLHVLQMTGLYVGQMAPSSFITNAAHFGAADEMRRVQRIAYWTKVLANAHADELATTALARGAWEDDPAWQPLRRVCEQLLVTRDWGEAFAARNLALKPVLDALLNTQLADLARRNSDEFLALLFTEFGVDAERSQDWSSALVRYALERRPELADVLTGWLDTWQPRAFEAAESLAAMFASAPTAMVPGQVADAVHEQHRAYLERCGLKSG
jgi:toluene monooxygenase system protein E